MIDDRPWVPLRGWAVVLERKQFDRDLGEVLTRMVLPVVGGIADGCVYVLNPETFVIQPVIAGKPDKDGWMPISMHELTEAEQKADTKPQISRLYCIVAKSTNLPGEQRFERLESAARALSEKGHRLNHYAIAAVEGDEFHTLTDEERKLTQEVLTNAAAN